MAIHDSDPERRNLIVTSIAFILYYFGRGEIVDHEVRIQLINITFHNSWVLAVMAWVMLLWFLFRYWQTHPDKVITEIKNDIKTLKDHPALIKYVEKVKNFTPNSEEGFKITDIGFKPFIGKGWDISIEFQKYKFDSTGRLISTENKGLLGAQLNGISSYHIKLRLIITAIIRKSGFSSYAVPYFLFFIAITSPLIMR